MSEHVGNQLPIITQCELDKPSLFHQLYIHLNPVAQNAMNVSFAAQVMSHTGAASIFAEVTRGEEHSTVFSQL
jgi:hypothetical protein